jgi:hypothetical protein
MGHSSITVTDNTYSHLFPERDAEINDRLRTSSIERVWSLRGLGPAFRRVSPASNSV